MVNNNRFLNIVDFIAYIDQLKNVTRKNRLHDHSREENAVEHFWHAALSGLLLAPYADQLVDVNKVVKMR